MKKKNTVLERNQIDDKYKWDLSLTFKNLEEWNNLYDYTEKRIPELKSFEGKLGEVDSLKEYLALSEELGRNIGKLYIYSYLRKDEDNRISGNIQLNEKAGLLYNYLDEHTSYFSPEILELSMDYIDEFISKYPEFKAHRNMFVDMFEDKKHFLSKDEEELLSSVSEVFGYPEDIADLLTNSDMKFEPIVGEDGEEIEVTEGNYRSLIMSPNREIRRQANASLLKGYKQYEATLGKTLLGSMKVFNIGAKIRKYGSFMNNVLEPSRIPLEVFTNTIDTVNANLDSVHNYYKLRKEALGLDKQYGYDTAMALIEESDKDIAFEDAVKMVREAVAVLGEDYIEHYNRIIAMNVIDVYPNKGKGSGAYSYGNYDVPPYVLLNYNGKLDDVSTLAHELGHSINRLYINETQQYVSSGNTIFCAEVASTVNEILLVKHILKNTSDIKVRINVLNDFIQTIIATVFTQVKYSEFEYDVHSRLENREILTGSDLSEIWEKLNVKYSGDSIEKSENSEIGWARISHFYSDFYVYKYATGYSAATQFATSILNGEEGAVERYMKFLSSGNCDYPVEILKSCGVDLTSKTPIESVANILKDSIEELRGLLKEINMI